MRKYALAFVLFFMGGILLSCSETTNPGDQDDMKPAWLSERIAEIQTESDRFGTIVYRHKWRNSFYYEVNTPIVSCLFCEVYNALGERMPPDFDGALQDYIENRSDEVVIWKWEKQ